MKKVLQNVSVLFLGSPKEGNWYTLQKLKTKPNSSYPVCPSGKCTAGPKTWYWYSGLDISNNFYPNGPYATYNANTDKPCNVYTLWQKGFKAVWHGTYEQAKQIEQVKGWARPGDVCTQIYNSTKQNKYGNYNSGHGCMFTGNDWRSDYLQGHMCASYDFTSRFGKYSVVIWRHPDYQESGKSGSNDALRGALPTCDWSGWGGDSSQHV